MRKLDFAVLTCACLGWLMKYIDQANLAKCVLDRVLDTLSALFISPPALSSC